MDILKKNKLYILILMLPGLAVYIFYVISPILIAAYYSLFKWNGVNDMKFLLFGNYVNLLKDEVFLLCLRNAGVYVGTILCFEIPVALAISVFLSYGLKGSRLHKILIFFPVIVSQVIIALIFNLLLNSEFGLVNSFFRSIGMEFLALDWLEDTSLAIWSVSLTNAWQYVGLVMVILLSGIVGIPDEVNQASRVDGANVLQTNLFITIPMIWEQIKVCIILQFVGTLNDFALIYNMTLGGPLHASEVPTTYMYKQSFQHMRYGYGMSISISIFVICIAFILVFNLLTMERKKQYSTLKVGD